MADTADAGEHWLWSKVHRIKRGWFDDLVGDISADDEKTEEPVESDPLPVESPTSTQAPASSSEREEPEPAGDNSVAYTADDDDDDDSDLFEEDTGYEDVLEGSGTSKPIESVDVRDTKLERFCKHEDFILPFLWKDFADGGRTVASLLLRPEVLANRAVLTACRHITLIPSPTEDHRGGDLEPELCARRLRRVPKSGPPNRTRTRGLVPTAPIHPEECPAGARRTDSVSEMCGRMGRTVGIFAVEWSFLSAICKRAPPLECKRESARIRATHSAWAHMEKWRRTPLPGCGDYR